MFKYLISALFGLVLMSPAYAVDTAVAVATCGGSSLTAGFTYGITQDLTGTLCTSAGGGGGGGLSVVDGATFTASTSAFTPGGGEFNSSPTTCASGKQCSFAITTQRALTVDTPTSNNNLYAAVTAPVPCKAAATWNAQTGQTGTQATGCDGSNALWVDQGAIGGVAVVPDPCQTATKVYTPVNVVTATNVIVTAVSAKKKYICGIFLYPAGTVNIAVYQATTATSCATAAADIFGGHTTGTGFLATATAGFVVGNGASAFAATNTVNTDICVTTSASVQVSGVVVTVDQ